ncbi:14065_t:CDS:2, partial [Cetraspora pellucida]
ARPYIEERKTDDFKLGDMTPEQHDQIKGILSQYKDIFAHEPNQLGRTSVVQHEIYTEEGPSVKQQFYLMSKPGDNRLEGVVEYASRSTKPTEQNYTITELECTTIGIFKGTKPKIKELVQHKEVGIVLRALHYDPTSSHLGEEATIEISRVIYIVVMHVNVMITKDSRSTAPDTGIDIVGPLPLTRNGNRYLVVAIEYLTKWPEVRVLPDCMAESVATFVLEDIVS